MAKNLVSIDLDNIEYSLRPYGTCSTAAATAAKTVAITDFTLCTGATVCVKFTNTNTASSPTLNVNGTGAKPINGGILTAVGIYEFIYDGGAWNVIKSADSDLLDGHDSDYFATKTEQDNLANQIQALSAGLKIVASANPSVVYLNESQKSTITGTVKDNGGNVTAEKIIIKFGTTEHIANDKDTTNISTTVNTTTTFTITAIAQGLPLSTTVTVTAKNAVYYGMGTSASAVKANGSKASARTSAVSSTTYDAVASSNGERFYLLVPSDVTRPTSFTMGGAPVDMVMPSSTTTIDGIAYYVFYTNATYNSGGDVQIKAN